MLAPMGPGQADYSTVPEVQAMKACAQLRKERRRLNLLAIFQNIIFPWVFFCILYAVMSFSIHHKHPSIAYCIAVAFLIPVFGAGWLAFRHKISRARSQALQWAGDQAAMSADGQVLSANGSVDDPKWFLFFFVMMCIAWILAIVLGDINFHLNLEPFYDLQSLNAYPSVDPSLMQGKEMMDVGRVFFVKDAMLDMTRTMAFKNLDHYCIAPITKGTIGAPELLDSYDFWAVGMNCCSGARNDFHCGDVTNPSAKGGLRLMHDEERPFYRLAVQQAEATYNIKANHPLFFTWMQDPNAAVNAYREGGMSWYLMGISGHFCFNLFCVVCAAIAFSKIEYY